MGIDGFTANIEDFGLKVDTATIKATVNGADAELTTSSENGTTSINYAFPNIPAPLSQHNVSLSFSDTAGNSYSQDLAFSITVNYKGVPGSFASKSVDMSKRGFIANVTQISSIQTEGPAEVHGGNLVGAEKQLSGGILNPNDLDDNDNPRPYLNEADPDAWEGWTIAPVEVEGVINWNQDEGGQAGSFGNESLIPQIPGWGDSSDGIVAEILTHLELKRGFHQFGVNRTTVSASPSDQIPRMYWALSVASSTVTEVQQTLFLTLSFQRMAFTQCASSGGKPAAEPISSFSPSQMVRKSS